MIRANWERVRDEDGHWTSVRRGWRYDCEVCGAGPFKETTRRHAECAETQHLENECQQRRLFA